MLSEFLQANLRQVAPIAASVMTDGSDRDPTAPAQYMAGWFYGVSLEDER